MVLQYATFSCLTAIYICCFSILYGMSIFLVAFIGDLRQKADSFSDMITRSRRHGLLIAKARSQVKSTLHAFIIFCSDIKQLSWHRTILHTRAAIRIEAFHGTTILVLLPGWPSIVHRPTKSPFFFLNGASLCCTILLQIDLVNWIRLSPQIILITS